MDIYKASVLLIFFLFVGFKLYKVITETSFTKLDKEAIELPKWSSENPNYDALYESFKNTDFQITDHYRSLSNRFISLNFSEQYWIFKTSYNTLDDGVWFFIIPTYTTILIVDRESHEIVGSKLFYRDITNTQIIDNELFFRYDDPMIWTLITNIHRLDELDSEINKLGKTNLLLTDSKSSLEGGGF